MPWDRSRYPDNWKEIRGCILERARDRCEWCGVQNHTITLSHRRDAQGALHVRSTYIVLTIAHLDATLPDGTVVSKHDKSHRHLEALAALCQACHLRYDHADHIQHAAETRRRRQIDAGQQEMPL